MEQSIPPHGGKLVTLICDEQEKGELLHKAGEMMKIPASSMEISDLIMIGAGAFSPLEGFMGKADYQSVLENRRLSNGLLWPIPITLAVSDEQAGAVHIGQEVAVVNAESGATVAVMKVDDKFRCDKQSEARSVFGTDDAAHPGVEKLYKRKDVYLGGAVRVLSEEGYPEHFPEYARPADTRKLFSQLGWRSIAAFQTRNPLHGSHEYITKVIMETMDGLLLHPVVGKLKEGDIPADVRMRCYRVLMDRYYPAGRAVCKVFPMEMRYAGPREALLHAIIRQNFGCSHFIVGRDHAGVGNYYGTYEAQNIFDGLSEQDLYIKPVKVENVFWCYKCDQFASAKTCPHTGQDHMSISGSKLRELLRNGEKPPERFSRAEVLEILEQYYQEKE